MDGRRSARWMAVPHPCRLCDAEFETEGERDAHEVLHGAALGFLGDWLGWL